jgi:hypothetical protein
MGHDTLCHEDLSCVMLWALGSVSGFSLGHYLCRTGVLVVIMLVSGLLCAYAWVC